MAVGGTSAVNWVSATHQPSLNTRLRDLLVQGWNGGSGMATIFAGFGIAPALAGAFGACVFLIAKFGILRRKNSAKWAVFSGPFWFFTAVAVCFNLSVQLCTVSYVLVADLNHGHCIQGISSA